MSMYYTDKPIDYNHEDLLDRGSFARLLAQTILNFKESDAFTIGLFGKWGTGKTSVVNMTLDQIQSQSQGQNNEVIIVRFEPWHFSDASQLLSQFFIRLSSEFKSKKDKNLHKIGSAIETYSHAFDLAKLIPVCGDAIASAAKFGARKLGRKLQNNIYDLDVLSQKQIVVDLLSQQKCRILVVIDDIDRLNSEQIRLVFQLVSSVAKFPNTTYLLVFDKNVVVKALEKVQEGNGEDFLEKVIQMPIELPEIPNPKLRSLLFERLDSVLAAYPNTGFNKTHWQELFDFCIIPFISNLRDINRLCNALRFKMTTISSEIDFADMVAISAIEIGAPQIYGWIKTQKDELTSMEFAYIPGAQERTPKEWHDLYKEKLAKYSTKITNPCVTETSVDTIISALSALFPAFGHKIGVSYFTPDIEAFRRSNLIAHPDKFDRYFYYDIDKIVLTKDKTENAIFSLPANEFMSFLIENDKNDQGISIIQELKARMNNLSSERAKVLFKALLLSTDELKTIERKSIVSVGASTHAEFLCLDLLEHVNSAERKSHLSTIIQQVNLSKLNNVAILINLLELGYGRLSANGKERAFTKAITLEELLEIETIFANRTKELLAQSNLFDCADWRMILHLLESFDPEYTTQYLKTAFGDSKNIVRSLWTTVTTWVGVGNSYEVNETYKKYLSENDVLFAIQTEVNSKQLFSLKEDVISRCAAFYLHSIGHVDYDAHISQASVDEVVSIWRTEGMHIPSSPTVNS